MFNPSTHTNSRLWPDYQSSDQFISTYDNDSHSNHPGWLLGNTIEGLAPPASWTGIANKPYVEEYVPPNRPQAMGVSDPRSLVWPTSAQMGDGSNNVAHDVDDRSNLMQMPYFRRQVLKHDQQARREGKIASVLDPSSYDIGTTQTSEQKVGGIARRNCEIMTATSHQFNGGESSLSPFSEPFQSVRKHIANNRQQNQRHRAQVHVQKEYSRQFSTAEYNRQLPKALTCYLPKLSRPSNPSQLQLTLRTMKPTIVYTRYSCDLACRSQGICVHFSFVLGGRFAPDGLICDRCTNEGTLKAVDADRECARHVDGRVYLAEDILATEIQAERAREVLRRAVGCDWDGISGQTRTIEAWTTDNSSSQWSSELPVQTSIEQSAGYGGGSESVWPSIEDVHCKAQPEAKRRRLDNQYTVPMPGDSLQDNQADFSKYLMNHNNGFSLENAVTPDFSAFMSKPNGGFG